ncbi:hypothetical protein U1P98_15840 [Lysinibacillus irui]|uniref:Uncharacterized protein n=1 Tax=Lysinibacillus irui TaxID=2998077 RepID=A0AAJ5RSA8_9BACI|nr:MULTISPECIES: hypothetical protein [Lysinibacillus]MEA0555210.1 hypothetical protein [Lysinibacillus irui]MEA0562228.1 hypothetical protein [Lysinibacillus irui]MEA0977781.1 hypothetical protein [Lysinibacillus irui]MEA1043935.1 hypothetical protein [Lysinibacillus irui]WDV08639.1 hypothetical protein OU989_09245 [Lysinibacillus irui]
MRLTKGISGFDAEHLIEQDMRMFQSMVYHLATSEKQVKVSEFIDQPHLVYMQAVVEIDREMLTILHHRFMPYIAFAMHDEELSFTFLSKAGLHKYFPMRKCLEAATLNTLLSKDQALHHLSATEWKYISYFNSQTIGDVMFNAWD